MRHIPNIRTDIYHGSVFPGSITSLRMQYYRPTWITSYRKIIKRIAHLTSYNPNLQILFRGQSTHYKNEKFQTLLLPSIYRAKPGEKLTNTILNKRFEILNFASNSLSFRFRNHSYPHGIIHLKKHKELCWGILQHYEVCATPLLDVTTDLDVALSFATSKGSGFLYILGVLNNYSAFSHDFENEIVFLKLNGLMPATALRPFFQKASLIGTWPTFDNKFRNEYNVSKRLLETLQVDKYKVKYSGFNSINDKLLFPQGDSFLHISKEIKKEIEGNYPDFYS